MDRVNKKTAELLLRDELHFSTLADELLGKGYVAEAQNMRKAAELIGKTAHTYQDKFQRALILKQREQEQARLAAQKLQVQALPGGVAVIDKSKSKGRVQRPAGMKKRNPRRAR